MASLMGALGVGCLQHSEDKNCYSLVHNNKTVALIIIRHRKLTVVRAYLSFVVWTYNHF